MVSRFVTSGPVKQDGICLLPPPPHYRMMPSQRSDAFPVATPAGSYVPQTQGPNQGPNLRGMQPTGPPNQSSTPPNADLKVQNLPGQMTQMQFVQGPVRTAQTPYFQNRGTAGPPSQTPRMPNQQHRPQAPPQLYPSAQYVMPSTVYLQPNMYFNPTQRPPSGIMTAQTYPQVYQQQLAYQTYSQQASSGVPTYTPVAYYPQQPTAMMSRAPVTPAAAAPPNTAPGNMQAAPLMPQPGQSHTNYQRTRNQRRSNAIPIIDPTTGEDKLDEIYVENNSHPASGESSARQTPQPAPPKPDKEVQAAFAKQVAQVLNEDKQHKVANEQPPSLHEPSPPEHFQLSPQPVQPISTAHIIQNSNLHYNAKEFVSTVAKPTKDSTPIVSANSDAAEVILPKKDRESPVKARKQGQRDPKIEPLKECQTKETECDRSSLVREDVNPVPQTTQIAAVASSPPPVTEPAPPVIKDVVKENADKKSVKKPIPVEPKFAEPVESNSQVPADVAASNIGKSKNSQKNKQISNQNGKSQQQQPQPQLQQQQPQLLQQQQPPLPIPVSQPPKANNRSNKTKELNMKGANKEGTDMDAFNDNVPQAEINANIIQANECSKVNDVVNANPILQSVTPPVSLPTIEPQPVINSQNISDTNEIDSNENVTTINSEHIINTTPVVSTATTVILKPMSKPFDVTSIIKDTAPKSILPFTIIDNKDETDRAVPQTDKIVLAKNDVNAKVTVENALNDIKSQLPYKAGQWAPDRQDGKKQYERDFLLALKNHPASRQKPDNIPDNVLQDDRNRPIDGRLSMGGRTDFTNPPFPYGGKSGSQRGPPPKRNSQSGKMGSRSGDKGSNKPLPKVSISLRGDVKLHESENAWKPTRFQKGEPVSEDDKKTAALYKRVRSVLNKLTPQKFDTLVNQVRQLQIDTKERLQGVINLVFDKAIDEPSFSVAYAKMCKELQIMQVPAGSTADKSVAFRTLLVTRCQVEFEKQSVDETERRLKLLEINECADPEKKKELSFELEEYDRRSRMKSVGCIRFIGELFKQQMLTASIMKRCLQTLLDNKDEESLECLCKLLTTVGKELESKAVDLASIFSEMKLTVDGKRQKVSSRIRFMLQDVAELRNCKWVPRRNDTNPKTMDQIQKEAETEHLNIQVMNMNTPRKDDRNMGPRGGGGQRQKVTDDGWNSVSNSRNNRQQQFSIQTDKMRAAKLPLADEPLGSSHMFGNWGKGAGASKNIQQPPVTTSQNMYAALENIDMDRRPNSRDNKDPYSSKGPSMERNSYKSSYDGRGSRSGSQHRDTGAPMRSSGPPPAGSVMLPAPAAQPKPAYTPIQAEVPPTVPKPTEIQIQRRIHNSLDEFLTGCSTTDEYFEDIAASVPPNEFSKVVYESYNYILEKSQPARLKTGELFAKLIWTGQLSLESFITGFQELLSLWEDLVIDIPQIWQYFAEDLVHLCLEEVLPINRLHKLLDCLIINDAGQKLLKPLFGLIVKEKGPNFLQNTWRDSGMQLSDFMSSSEVQPFVKENNFEFLVGGESPVGQSPLSYEEIQRKLSEFFKSKTPFDDIVNWISANIGDRVKENKFIRSLATAIFEDSISKNKLVNEQLTGHTKLIQKYVDNNTEHELQCLYALQSLAHKLEHPQGLLLAICDKLYEDSTFCQESFIAWENSTDPSEQEGKGVALKQLTSFFTQLKENEEDEDYSSNSEDA